jgi:hypothetical protein
MVVGANGRAEARGDGGGGSSSGRWHGDAARVSPKSWSNGRAEGVEVPEKEKKKKEAQTADRRSRQGAMSGREEYEMRRMEDGSAGYASRTNLTHQTTWVE